MEYIEYKKLKNTLGQLLLKFQVENEIEDEWMLRMLLEECRSNVVRFEGSD